MSIENSNYVLKELSWDSSYFGVRSAKLELNNEIDPDNRDSLLLDLEPYEFITIVNKNNVASNNAWIALSTNAILTDINVQYRLEIESELSKPAYTYNFQSELKYNDDIVRIADESFVFSRFYNDPFLSKKLSRSVYKHWAQNAFEQKNLYYLTIHENHNVVGFILSSYQNDALVIELFAVAKEHQKKGIGKLLFEALAYEVQLARFSQINVGTQFNNIGANNFYSKLGFTMISVSSIYHLWRSNE